MIRVSPPMVPRLREGRRVGDEILKLLDFAEARWASSWRNWVERRAVKMGVLREEREREREREKREIKEREKREREREKDKENKRDTKRETESKRKLEKERQQKMK